MSNAEIEQAKNADSLESVLTEQTHSRPGNARRRLFKAGLTVSPVVMTLASRPVLAWHCTTGSVFASGNTSAAFLQQQGTITNEGTHTISDYCNGSSYWPSSIPRTTKFCSTAAQCSLVNSVFAGSTLYTKSGSSTNGNASLLDVLSGNCTTAVNPLHKDIIVALLNRTCVQNVQSCITLQNLNGMFVYGTAGTYTPLSSKPSLKWGYTEIHNYLSQNWLLG